MGIASAALHGERAGNQGFVYEGFDLRTKAGLAIGEQAEAFDSCASHNIRWIVVERHEQPGGAQAMGA